MGILKFQATKLFDGYRLLDSNHVLITDEKGTIQEIVPLQNTGDDVQQLDGILTPGFVNAHCHLELSHLKGMIPEHTGLVDFVFTVVTQRHLPGEAIAEAIANAEDAMLANGIVAVGDICNNTSTLLQKQKGRLAYYNFIETSGWLPEVANARFDRSKENYEAFASSTDNCKLQTVNCKLSIVPHAPYSVSNELWQLMHPFFNGNTVTIHNQETAFEDDLFKSGTGDFLRMYEKMHLDNSFFTPSGKTSLQSYLPKILKAGQVLLVHNTFTTEADMVYANNLHPHINWCLCPNANQYIENALPPLDLLRKQHCNIVLGTDSLASNHSLSILDEMKTIGKHFTNIPLGEMLGWATINGAKALNMDIELGSFEKGKRPGVVLVENLEDGKLGLESIVRRLV
jgi:aminodeoxyfutalosine deaminase